jgi:hypothetical protein
MSQVSESRSKFLDVTLDTAMGRRNTFLADHRNPHDVTAPASR